MGETGRVVLSGPCTLEFSQIRHNDPEYKNCVFEIPNTIVYQNPSPSATPATSPKVEKKEKTERKSKGHKRNQSRAMQILLFKKLDLRSIKSFVPMVENAFCQGMILMAVEKGTTLINYDNSE